MTTQLDAVIEKHAASKTPAVLLTDQRHYEDAYAAGTYFGVDILEYEALGLSDTHAVFCSTYDEAIDFAGRLGHLLGIDLEIIL